jgi:hypothetical protein
VVDEEDTRRGAPQSSHLRRDHAASAEFPCNREVTANSFLKTGDFLGYISTL